MADINAAIPLVFNTRETMAILKGRMTQTRRTISPQPLSVEGLRFVKLFQGCARFGNDRSAAVCDRKLKVKPGDIIWVREKFHVTEKGTTVYAADKDFVDEGYKAVDGNLVYADNLRWKPSRYMPRDKARIFLLVTDVRAERLRDITEENATQEGFTPKISNDANLKHSAKAQFQAYWRSLYAKRGASWESNPWVWVYEFEMASAADAEALERAASGAGQQLLRSAT